MNRFTPDDLIKKGYSLQPNGQWLKLYSPDRPLAPELSYAKLEPTPREEPLDTHQAQEGRKGRTLVCITRCGAKLLDKDNLYGSVKPILDALRYAGLVRDDGPSDILLHVRQRKTKKEYQGTEIIIDPIP